MKTKDKIRKIHKYFVLTIFPGNETVKKDFFKDLEIVLNKHDCFGWIR
ncbi:hypothetical protein ES702_07153 [subsurface metagenome]